MPDPGPKPTGIAARRWLSWAAILVLIPYAIVWGKTDSFNYAFEVLTGTGHPFNNGAGPVAAILALEGYPSRSGCCRRSCVRLVHDQRSSNLRRRTGQASRRRRAQRLELISVAERAEDAAGSLEG